MTENERDGAGAANTQQHLNWIQNGMEKNIRSHASTLARGRPMYVYVCICVYMVTIKSNNLLHLVIEVIFIHLNVAVAYI